MVVQNQMDETKKFQIWSHTSLDAEHCAAFERENVLLHRLPALKLCAQFYVMIFITSFVTALLSLIRTMQIFVTTCCDHSKST